MCAWCALVFSVSWLCHIGAAKGEGSEVERVVDMAGTRFSGEDMKICAEMRRDEAVGLDYVPNGEGSILIRRNHY